MKNRRVLGGLLFIAAVVALVQPTGAFSTTGQKWPRGNINMTLQLAGGSGLSDGSANFNAAASSAAASWNQYLNRARFVTTNGNAGRGVDGDFVNQVFFDSNYYGHSFGNGVLAITTSWTDVGGSVRLEADVIFNSAIPWDSYRGTVRSNGVWDLRRIALHEFGHVLGLDHPDEKGQRVNALMNSQVGNLDSLVDDDIAGAQSLYGGGVSGNITFPPRNEGLQFMNTLDATYRDSLRRSLGSSVVNNEGAVVWVLEYLRYRLNGCNHGDATTKVLQQIRGLGIQPVCTA
jgi:hypothetical protein